MAKINILFTLATLAEMSQRNAPVPEGFDGPEFLDANLTLDGSFVVVQTKGTGPNGQPPAVYMYPASAVARIKISD